MVRLKIGVDRSVVQLVELVQSWEQPWEKDASCREGGSFVIPDVLQAGGSRAFNQFVKAAKGVCESCPVRQECLVEGFKVDEHSILMGKESIYGGLTYIERRDLRARLGRGERDLWSA